MRTTALLKRACLDRLSLMTDCMHVLLSVTEAAFFVHPRLFLLEYPELAIVSRFRRKVRSRVSWFSINMTNGVGWAREKC